MYPVSKLIASQIIINTAIFVFEFKIFSINFFLYKIDTDKFDILNSICN